MDLTLTVLSGVLLLLGLVGCVLPVLPGPALSLAGMAALAFTSHSPSRSELLALGVLAVLVTLFDYAAPVVGAKWFKCSKSGMRFSMIGAVAGLFFLPLGILVGPLVGAVAGELYSGKKFPRACWSGVGVFIGYIGGMLFKLVFCGYLLTFYLCQIWP